MRYLWIPLSVVLTAVLVLPAMAQQESIHWHSDLESAKSMAKASGRLVLIHFWAPSCGPCLALDQNVFNQPGVAPAIEAKFVPVKLNADENSATAQWYGINRIPTDVVITPDGQVVGKLVSPPTPMAYVQETTTLATKFAAKSGQGFAAAVAGAPVQPQVNAAYAGLQLGPSLPPGIAPQAPNANSVTTSSLPQFPTASGVATTPGGSPATSPMFNSASVGYAMPNAAAPAPAVQPNQLGMNGPAINTGFAPNSASTVAPQTFANPAIAAPALAAAQPPITPIGQPAAAGPSGQVPNPYYASTTSAPPAQQPVPQMTAPMPSATSYGGPGAAAQIGVPNLAAAAPLAGAAPAAMGPMPSGVPDLSKLPAGSPPLGFDGYCPVSMRNTWKWIPGNPQWGIVHRGRTYWFATAEEQKQFWTDPDRYTPALSGMDPVLVIDHKQQVPGKREHSLDFDGLFYMFASEATLQQFSANPQRYAAGVRQAMGIPRGRLVK